jgi:hypothetical protein
MAINLDVESPVSCSCGEMAIRRTVQVRHETKGARMVSYDTHDPNFLGADNLAAMNRMDTFHERLHDLLSELKALSTDDRKLSSGMIIDFDIETIHPDACNVRTDIVSTASIQAFGLRAEVRLTQRPLKEQTAASILADIKEASLPQIERLKAIKANGDY